MKHAYIFVAAFFLSLLPQIAIAQSSWVWQNPLPQGNDLNAAHFTTSENIWLVGSVGAVLHTTDRGGHWELVSTGEKYRFTGIAFAGEQAGLLTGMDGSIRRTTDAGMHWNKCTFVTNDPVVDVVFLDSSYCIALLSEYAYLRSTNKGIDWDIDSLPTKYALTKVCPIRYGKVDTFFITGYIGTILRTTDYGENWTLQPSGTREHLNDIFFTNDTTGCIVGTYGTILRTTDCGLNWVSVESGTTEELTGVHFSDESHGIIVGYSGVVLLTYDGGKSWTKQPRYTTIDLNGVQFGDPSYGIAFGKQGEILYTTDSGETWVRNLRVTSDPVFSVLFSDSANGIAVGGNGIIMHTHNGGAAWLKVFEDSTLWNLTSIGYFDSTNIIAMGSSSHGSVRSTDNGKSWMKEPWNKGFLDISCLDSVTAIAVGYDGVHRTTDGGFSWIKRWSSANRCLYGISFSDNQNGVAVGNYGTILFTNDGGITWSEEVPFASVEITYMNVCLTSLYSGYIIGVEDPGPGPSGPHTYFVMPLNPKWNDAYRQSFGTNVLHNIDFADSNNGFIVGDNGLLLRTTDAGRTWKEELLTHDKLYGVDFRTPYCGTIVGDNGIIIHFTQTDTTDATSKPILPDHIHLSQNYPNPFSSNTTILVTLEKPEFVSLRVYNMLGAEVAVLMDERKEAGAHTATWNPVGLPGGVYFYVLRTGAATATKAMVRVNQ